MRSRKGVKLLLIIGLLSILLYLALVKKSAMGLKNRTLLLFTKYRALIPYIVAQAQLETANFTSKVYLTDNNMFGMKVGSSGKPGLKAPANEGNGIADPRNYYRHFENDTESLLNLLQWFDRRNMPVTVENAAEYAKALQARSYFTAGLSVYQKNLEYWLNENKA